MSEYDAIVIGSGAYGASTAFHLALRGKRVAVIDRAALNSQTSMRAAGLATAPHGTPQSSRIAQRSLEAFRGFEELTGQPLRIWETGALKVARRRQDVTQLEAEVALGRSVGIECDLVDAGFVAARAPFYDAGSVLLARWTPGDVYLNPGDVPTGYLRAAAALGAEMVQGCEVVTVVPEAGGGFASRLADGRVLQSAAVVNAAGAWCRALAARTGVDVPALAIRHQLLITGPLAGVDPSQPCVRVTDLGCYIRPEGHGLLFGAYEPDPPDPVDRGPRGGMEHLELDLAPLARVLDGCGVPALLDAPVAELRGGLPTVTPDRKWLVDQAPECPGYFVLNGDNVGGLSTSPALGETLAAWIAEGGDRPAEIEPYRMDRFEARDREPQRLAELCHLAYVDQYSRAPEVSSRASVRAAE